MVEFSKSKSKKNKRKNIDWPNKKVNLNKKSIMKFIENPMDLGFDTSLPWTKFPSEKNELNYPSLGYPHNIPPKYEKIHTLMARSNSRSKQDLNLVLWNDVIDNIMLGGVFEKIDESFREKTIAYSNPIAQIWLRPDTVNVIEGNFLITGNSLIPKINLCIEDVSII